jgi:cellulose biosynthesis protein BcsQ
LRIKIAQKIALFNHTGGVGKTTTTFNLGWMLAEKGTKVILVDTDPQFKLMGIALGEYKEANEERIEAIYQTHSNTKTGIAPTFESRPKVIEPVECIQIGNQEGLYLLPGHVGLAEYEAILGTAQELRGSLFTSCLIQ